MPIEKYLIESVRQMHTLLVQCEVNSQKNADCLLKASALGCLTLKRLCDDPEFQDVLDEFADVRLISTFIQKRPISAKAVEPLDSKTRGLSAYLNALAATFYMVALGR